MQKFEYLENEKCFLDEIKNIFHNFWRAIIWWEIKFDKKIVDTGFKVFFFDTPCFATSSCPYCNLKIPTALMSIEDFILNFSYEYISEEVSFLVAISWAILTFRNLLSKSNNYRQ